MIGKLEIHGVHMDIDPKLFNYVTKKIGRLDHYASRHVRESLHCEVFLKEEMLKKRKVCTCEVVLHLPQETITTKESTMNIYAAVDIVENKLKNLLKKYKDTHGSLKIHRRILARLKRQAY
jgi:ribosomal subunit interface protein